MLIYPQSFPIKDLNRMKAGKEREAAFNNNKDARKLQSVQPRDGELRESTVDLSPYLTHTQHKHFEVDVLTFSTDRLTGNHTHESEAHTASSRVCVCQMKRTKCL